MELAPTTVLVSSALFSALALMVAATESWSMRRQYGPAGILSTTIIHQVNSGRHIRESVSRHTVRLPFKIPTIILIEIGAASALVILASVSLLGHSPQPFILGLWIAVAVAAIANLVVEAFTPAGQDGADQMASIVLVACSIGLAPGLHPIVATCAVWFIALQACLAYATSGIAKAISRDWRTGEAIRLIFRTSSYGNRWIRRMLVRYQHLPQAMGISVIACECLFSVAVFLGGPFLLAALSWGLLFHLSVVAIMRLNTFALAFPATYFAIYAVGY